MCSTCGCGQPDDHVKITVPGEKEAARTTDGHTLGHDYSHHGSDDHHHNHHHDHSHDHSHDNRQLDLEKDILYKNNLLAERNRGFLEAKNILALNLVSSPGSSFT